MLDSIKKPKRLESADVYRGFVMLLMMAEVLDFSKVSESIPNSSFWAFMAQQQSHVLWTGCSLHDMIQPSFSFLVGVVMPYSIASKSSVNSSFNRLFLIALKRSLILILLGVFLRSMHAEATNWTFEDTLSQIGMGYPFLFMLGFKSNKIQYIVFVAILFLYWLAFALYPLPGPTFNYWDAGTTANYTHNLTGFAAHWNLNTNLASSFDHWFLNLFPRPTLFTNNGGGYSTLSFIPTLATMILGLIAGNQLISIVSIQQKLKNFLIISICLIISGLVLHFAGICPIVKRIWTPSWVLFSGGICFLFLSIFIQLVDINGYHKYFNWLKIIGMNSIVAYVLAHTIDAFIKKSFEIHLGKTYSTIFGVAYQSLVSGTIILTIILLILNWMYKKKLFIRI
jgi:predicted acyltransferase